MSPPLISYYKKGFTVKRLSETFLGGPRLFFAPPVYIALQIGLFTIPAIIVIIINLTAPDWGTYWTAIVIGLSVLVVDLSLALGLSFLKRVKRTVAASPIFSRRGSIFLAEEDQAEYEGFFSRSTWIFVAPNPTVSDPLYVVGIIISATGFALNAPLVIVEQTGNAFIRGLSLFALCNSRYSAVISLPPEVSTFDPIRRRNLLYRPFYVNLLGLGHLAIVLSNGEPSHSFWFLLCLSILPLLWGVGFLPPLDALFPWLAEIVLKIMGGSPTFFYIGNFLALLIALMSPVIVFISRLDNVFIILIECLLGYMLSSDIGMLLRLKSLTSETRRDTKKFSALDFLKPTLTVLLSLVCTSIPMIVDIAVTPTEITLLVTSLTTLLISYVIRQFLITKIRHRISLLSSILDVILIFLIQFWIAVEISTNKSHMLSLKQLITEVLTIRAFSLSVVHPRLSAIDISIAVVLQLCELSNELDFIVLLFFVSIFQERLYVFLRHSSFIGIVLYSTVRTVLLGNLCSTILSLIILLPYSVLSLLISSLIEGATLSALFTLPIFLVGFPRPNSYWKGSWFPKSISNFLGAKKNVDWIIYADVAKSLTSSFVRYFSAAHLNLESGNCYVARYEDRLLFLRIVSSGWNFAYIQVKGLEMQEQTSCHHQEAAAMDELFENWFGPEQKPLFGLRCPRSPGILQPLTTFRVPTYSESKSNILSLKTKEERGVFRKMFFRTFSYLWMKNNPLLHGIDAYRKSICSGYNLHSTENSSLASTPHLGNSRDNNSFDYEMSNDKFPNDLMFNYPHSIDEMNNRNMGTEDYSRRKKKSFGNELPVWTLSHLPALPGMEFRKSNNDNADIQNDFGRKRGPSNLLTNSWLVKCVGDVILSQDLIDKVEELCWEVWTNVFSDSIDFVHVDLQRFFSESFVGEVLQRTKLGISSADISISAFRYAAKLTLDEIYNSFETTPEDEILKELTFLEDHCIRLCTPSEIGAFIQQKEDRIFSMLKTDDGLTQLRIYNYEKDGVEFRVGKMSRSCVEGIWANLNTELLYLTSDDDERYSIQQDKYLMRNITTQCANPPLGYPVYEAAFRINLLNYNIDQI